MLKQVHIKLSEDLHKQLKIQAAIESTTIQGYVVRAIEQLLAKRSYATALLEDQKSDEDYEDAHG